MKGWYGNRQAHMLASRGIKSKCINNNIHQFPDFLDEDDDLETIMLEYNRCVGEHAIFGAEAYAGTRHYDMNHFLLSGEKTNEYIDKDGVVRWNQEIMEKGIEEFKKYIKDAPKYTGEVWRGMGLDMDYPLDKELLEKINHSGKTGEPLNFGTFLSTSNLYDSADNYIYGQDLPMMTRIYSGNNSGVYLGNAIHSAFDKSDDYNQNEVVFSPDSQFEVVEFKKEEYFFKTHNGYESRDGYYLELVEI